jgi:hypothetical protein
VPELFFTCPKTKQRASTGIESDLQSLRASWSKTLKVNCSFCGKGHDLAVRETYAETILHDATDAVRFALLRVVGREVAISNTRAAIGAEDISRRNRAAAVVL